LNLEGRKDPMHCYNCNATTFEQRVLDLKTEVGEHTVLNHTVTRPVCTACGEYTVDSVTLEQVELCAALVAFSDAPRVSGPMLKFARKALGLKQTELGERIGATAESISRWEREERPAEPWVPLAVLGLVRERLMPLPAGVELLKAAS
jgi:YgiT-type zinc finger domain-containing protein